MGAAIPFIIPGMVAGATVSAAQKKDPLKGALYGAGTGGIGAAVIGGSPKGAARAEIPPAPPAVTLEKPSPKASPTQADYEEALAKDRARRRQRIRQAGRQGTILTEGGLGEPQIKKATLLGGGSA